MNSTHFPRESAFGVSGGSCITCFAEMDAVFRLPRGTLPEMGATAIYTGSFGTYVASNSCGDGFSDVLAASFWWSCLTCRAEMASLTTVSVFRLPCGTLLVMGAQVFCSHMARGHYFYGPLYFFVSPWYRYAVFSGR